MRIIQSFTFDPPVGLIILTGNFLGLPVRAFNAFEPSSTNVSVAAKESNTEILSNRLLKEQLVLTILIISKTNYRPLKILNNRQNTAECLKNMVQ